MSSRNFVFLFLLFPFSRVNLSHLHNIIFLNPWTMGLCVPLSEILPGLQLALWQLPPFCISFRSQFQPSVSYCPYLLTSFLFTHPWLVPNLLLECSHCRPQRTLLCLHHTQPSLVPFFLKRCHSVWYLKYPQYAHDAQSWFAFQVLILHVCLCGTTNFTFLVDFW